jgi:hypothetical protein
MKRAKNIGNFTHIVHMGLGGKRHCSHDFPHILRFQEYHL